MERIYKHGEEEYEARIVDTKQVKISKSLFHLGRKNKELFRGKEQS